MAAMLETPALIPESSVAILKEARVILRFLHSWTTKAYARTSYKKRVNPKDANAVQFSLMGAVQRAKHNLGFNPNAHDDTRNWMRLAIDRYVNRYPETRPKSVEEFNDARKRKHADVLQVLDDAIEIGEALILKARTCE